MAPYRAVAEFTGASDRIAVNMTSEEFAAYRALPAPRPGEVTGHDGHGDEERRMTSGTPTVEEAEQGGLYLVVWSAEV